MKNVMVFCCAGALLATQSRTADTATVNPLYIMILRSIMFSFGPRLAASGLTNKRGRRSIIPALR
jgi:hypothetical protein